MKNLLVTGGAGFIGSCFVNQAVQKGHHVVVLDAMTYAGHRENLDWIEPKGSWKLVVGDITNGELVASLLKEHDIDAVVHFAAESHVDNSIEAPGEFITTNVTGTYTLLEAARQYYGLLKGEKKDEFRFLGVSTDEVYGSLELESDDKFSETTAYDPRSPYSASKAAADHLVSAWFHTYGLPTIITNCTNNYGPRQYPEKLIPLMISRALSGQSLPVYGDGKNVRDWIHVEDHSRGVYLALTKGQPGQTYAFGGDAEKPNLEVVHTLCDTLEELAPHQGRKYRDLIAFVPDRLGHDRRYAIDDSKAQKELGFSRTYQFDTGLKQTIQWYFDNREWCDAVLANNKAA